MPAGIVRSKGNKRPDAHVQCDLKNFKSASANTLDHRRRAMKTSGRRCDSDRNFCVDGLVFLRVGWSVFSFEIRRNRNMAMRFKEIFDRFGRAKLKKTEAQVTRLEKVSENTFHSGVAKDDPIAGADAFAGAA